MLNEFGEVAPEKSSVERAGAHIITLGCRRRRNEDR
jgi:hypothetical protein